jgi:putative ABC transport system permease protein
MNTYFSLPLCFFRNNFNELPFPYLLVFKLSAMFQNYLTVALRNLSKNKIYSTINIAGLAMGIAAFLFILEYVSLEKSVNQFHAKLPNLARMLCQNAQGENWPQVEPGWAEIAKSRLPEIKSYCRFAEGGVAQGIVQNQLKNLSFREQTVGYVEGNFFEFFSFRWWPVRPKTLTNPMQLLFQPRWPKNTSVRKVPWNRP